MNVPDELKKYKTTINEKRISVNYDKNITTISEIISILKKYNLTFNEIQTFESDLEDIFLELIKKNK